MRCTVRNISIALLALAGSAAAVLTVAVAVVVYEIDAQLPTAAEITEYADRCGEVSEGCGSRLDTASLPKHVQDAFLAAERWRPSNFCGLCDYAPWQPETYMTLFVVRSLLSDKSGGSRMSNWHLKAAVMTMKTERVLRQENIVQIFLNEFWFGSGVRGIDAATQRYFGKRPVQLSLAQAAYLAALVKSPSRYLRNPARALVRRNWVIDEMAAQGMLDADEAVRARETPLDLKS